MKKTLILSTISALFAPNLAFAVATPTTFRALVYIFIDLIQLAIPVAFSLALVVFVWGVAQFILNSGNATALADGKQKMFWGIVGLFVIFSIWGILALVGDSFGITILTR